MKKYIFLLTLIFSTAAVFAQSKAFDIAEEASKKSSVEDAISYVKNSITNSTPQSDRRSLYVFMASLQEQSGLYEDAMQSYVKAAAIASADADKMPKKTNEQLVLDAVRCALSAGDFSSAESFLNSAVRNSKNENIQAYIKLYSAWALLCRAEKESELEEPVTMLKAYSTLSSMKNLRPSILLTLWYVTGDKSYSEDLKKKYPKSTETAIVKGDSQMLPTPFWFFVPKIGSAEPESGTFIETAKIPESSKSETPVAGTNINGKNRLQLGLFSSQGNAKSLCDELIKKGFAAYIETDKKASGNVYYLVLVDEKDENTADSLRSMGYECYLVN